MVDASKGTAFLCLQGPPGAQQGVFVGIRTAYVRIGRDDPARARGGEIVAEVVAAAQQAGVNLSNFEARLQQASEHGLN